MGQQVTADIGVQDAAFLIAGWSVDLSTLCIYKQNKSVKLEPKVMLVLKYLASRPGQVVSRQELEEQVWAGTVVGYDAISNAIIKLRKAFGDDAKHPEIIQTIPKTGYRLIAAVEVRGNTRAASRVTPDSENPDHPVANAQNSRSSRRKFVVAVITPLLLVVAVVSIWLQPWVTRVEPASVKRMSLPLPDRPSIAVLPFNNMSSDAEQEYFVDGITEDLITDLSKLSGLFVVARNSVFTYKGRVVKIRQVAEELGVRYVLEGSAQRSGDQVRINAQLIDALSGGHVWAERYDGKLDDTFSFQDQVTNGIVGQLAINLSLEEDASIKGVKTAYSEAYDLFVKGWGHYRAGSAKDFAIAAEYLELAIKKDPGLVRAQAAIAAVYWSILSKGWWQESLEVHYYQAFELARKALRRSQKNPTALTHQIASEWITNYAKGTANPQRALDEAEQALALDPNNPAGYLAKANALLNRNQPREAEYEIRMAMRIDPHFPPEYLVLLAQAQIHLGDYQAAVESLETSIEDNPDDSWAYVYLSVAYGQLGDRPRARGALDQANQLRARSGWGPVTILAAAHSYFRWRGKKDHLKQGLIAAGASTGGEWYGLINTVAQDKAPELAGVPVIDVATAKQLHEDGAVFVETHSHWAVRHIPGAQFLEWWGEGWLFNEAALQQIANKDTKVVVYSYEPRTKFSAYAAAFAKSRGFDNVYYFYGGTEAWEAAGYPIETGKYIAVNQ